MRSRKQLQISIPTSPIPRDDDDDVSGKNKRTFPLVPVAVLVLICIFAVALAKHLAQQPVKEVPSKRFASPIKYEAPKDRVLTDSIELTAEEDANLEIAEDGNHYHLIFSTDCSPFQHWQSYLFFYAATQVRQPGHVTRIASGCTDEEGEEAQRWFDEHISGVMSKRYHLHLTPHFSGVKKDGKTVGDYKFFNKPYGLRHWLEHGNHDGKMNEDTIVILNDPDMVLLRPITGDFANDRETIVSKNHARDRAYKVEHGRPFAQLYGLGAKWREFNLTEIAGKDSPAKKVNYEDAQAFYPAGPPYLATAKDMLQIAIKWTEFVPKVHAEYPNLLAEMYAYCIAAAHLGLRHQLIDSLMVSNTVAGGEGWPLVDNIPASEVCDFARNPDHSKYPVPSVLHYCQRYTVGDNWFYGKRKMPKNIFTCDSPLLEEPPSDLAEKYTYQMPPGGRAKDKKPISAKRIGRESFAICLATASSNKAADFFKQKHCSQPNNERMNFYSLFH